jgi:hypothetical protein
MKKITTFFAAIVMCSPLIAQIPNSGFETWTTTSGYDIPTGWDQLNAMTMPSSTYTCVKGTPGISGASYIKLTSKTVGTSVVPGVAVSGLINMTTFAPKSGFAYTSRPANLTGSWQYMAYGADQGHIAVLLSKWNTSLSKRDTISLTTYALSGMVMSWATFSIPLTYSTGAIPDSAIIVLSASGTTPVNMSYLYVDNLAFTGTVTAGIANTSISSSLTSIYPNPATGITTISYNSISGKDIKIYASDISGKTVLLLTEKVIAGENNLPISVANLTKGIYTIKILDGQNIAVQKLIVE